MKKYIWVSLGILTALTIVSAAAVYAGFLDKGKYLGSKFSVASADLKLLNDITAGVEETNLVDEKPGPEFENITPEWYKDYPIKLYSNATTPLLLSSYSNYETANDPVELRQIIYVEIFEWDDDGDGIVQESEVGTSYGRKSVIKWKTEGFVLGEVNPGELKNVILRFSTNNVSDGLQGKSALFDFEFHSAGI